MISTPSNTATPATPPTLIAVYGTLLTGEPNHDVLGDARLLGAGLLVAIPSFGGPAEMWDTGGYPALRARAPGEHRPCPAPRVEVFEVDAETLQQLDRLEGHPRLFRRVPAAARLAGAEEPILVQVYVWASPWADVCWRRIDDADWRKRAPRGPRGRVA